MINSVYIHPSAEVHGRADIGAGTKIWNYVQVREDVVIGNDCILSKDVYIDIGVKIGSRCKIQNGVSVYCGVTLEDDVFLGPYATLTNDKVPRAFNRHWKIVPTLIKRGASIGANATIICGVTIGEYAMVGAGSVVTKDVAPYSLVVGNPARHFYFIDRDGNKVDSQPKEA
ncbi:MAG: N-acetyltransferase [Candidatus Brocadiae bacterium]|nr:N-acetyltransferase [Candidatus Brocadiia bacterium]